jgi:hypothetical protein
MIYTLALINSQGACRAGTAGSWWLHRQQKINKHTVNPDRLQKTAPTKRPSVEGVTEKRVFNDITQTMELYKIQGSITPIRC